MKKGNGENWKYIILSDVKVLIFTPFWQEIDNFHLKFEFYDNENYKIASTWIIKKSWNTSKRSHFGYILAVGSTLKGSLLVANNKSMSYKVDSFVNHSTCQNWCCLLTSAGEVSWAWERETGCLPFIKNSRHFGWEFLVSKNSMCHLPLA